MSSYHFQSSTKLSKDANSGISGFSLRGQEKQDLRDIHGRLCKYIQQVRESNEQSNQVDSSTFVNSVKTLEDEIQKLKGMFEAKLFEKRKRCEELSKERIHYSMQASKLQGLVLQLESRLAMETDSNHKVSVQLRCAQTSLSQREQELQETGLRLDNIAGELERQQRAYNTVLRENEELRRRCDHGVLLRKHAEDKWEQLQKTIEFQDQVHSEQANEQSGRLEAASAAILSLESKIRELSTEDSSLSDMLERVRGAAEEEFTRYREESEQIYNQNLSELKRQLDEMAFERDKLNGEIGDLNKRIGELTTQITAMEGELASLHHQKQSAEGLVESERARAHNHIHSLEAKMGEMQDMLVIKMREITAAREAQIPLKAEIESLKALLEEEESRLLVPAGGCQKTAAFTSSSQYTGGGSRTVGPVYPHLHRSYGSAPVGPLYNRSKSAPVDRSSKVTATHTSSLGQSQDYFDQMFSDMKKAQGLGGYEPVPQSPPASQERPTHPEPELQRSSPLIERPPSMTTHDYTTFTSSATGDVKIWEVHPEGKYIRLQNASQNMDIDLGNHTIQQNVGGHPVAVYRFPERLKVSAGDVVTVWSGTADPMNHQPPTDFVFREQQKWGTGPECTTILCKPNGQAVAWTTAAHRFTTDAFDNVSQNSTSGPQSVDNNMPDCEKEMQGQDGELKELQMNGDNKKVYLKREKESPPSLHAQKHPHGNSPPMPCHPHTGQGRVLTYGNDNSSVNRQTRSQGVRPDPVPGAPYAGAAAQRMGSSSLRRYTPPTIKGSGALANKSEGGLEQSTTSKPPSSFQKPHARFNTGLEQIQSQYNTNYHAPMPRPPLFSAW